ncbi:type VII secretion target [Microbacterium sp. SORGH_AS_0421]|uniref:type VII secretion target n=1 Tax=Microbacterium sp. SORGH_AS_0421 TaxID=3041768 RepID=UPI0027912C0A|nr:type VII secretion target [Microbacterium sp. SORGH_AS_0421]MDQ1176274.1 hypothetical protein [Microbacterium sp. SORGH_AS_0421]
MSDDRIRVDPDFLRQHARKVAALSSDVAEAASAAGHVSLGGQAFGIICAFAATPTTLLGLSATGALQSVERALGRAATAATQMADDFEDLENRFVYELETLRAKIDGGVYT